MINASTRKMNQRHKTTSSSDTASSCSRTGEKYALRPRTIIKRLQQERSQHEVPRSNGCRSRPAPMSKYRRKTANARERNRMKQINNAFESLRRILPDTTALQPASPSMTKITTLRLAVSYIRALSDVLEDGVTELYSLGGCLQDSIQSSLQQSLHQHSIQLPLDNTLLPESSVTLRYEDQISSLSQQFVTEVALPLGYCSSSDASTNASNSSVSPEARESLGSTSDIEDLLSDDSRLLEDSLYVFHDMPSLAADPFDVLLQPEARFFT